jgi:hypothetical protein
MGRLHFSNNARLVAAGWRMRFSNGQLHALPLRSAESLGFVSRNEDSRDHVLSNYFGADGHCLPSTWIAAAILHLIDE